MKTYLFLATTLLLATAACLFVGSVDLSAVPSATARYILLEMRLPSLLTGIAAGAALSIAGLAMQTLMDNPLADPSLLGVGSGASLGSALVFLLGGEFLGACYWGGITLSIVAAFLGALTVTFFLIICSETLESSASLLIIGIMLNFLISSIITIFIYFSAADSIQNYILWSMGSIGRVQLSVSVAMLLITMLIAVVLLCYSKPLNAYLLGESHTSLIGYPVRHVRSVLLVAVSLLCALVTALCGPITFIGLAAPHAARFLTPTADHRRLIPVTLLVGITMVLVCHVLCMLAARSLTTGTLPLNVLTPLLGVPIIFFLLLRK